MKLYIILLKIKMKSSNDIDENQDDDVDKKEIDILEKLHKKKMVVINE